MKTGISKKDSRNSLAKSINLEVPEQPNYNRQSSVEQREQIFHNLIEDEILIHDAQIRSDSECTLY